VRNYTVEPLIGLLRTQARFVGLDLEVWLGQFDTVHQELRDPQSQLYAFRPELLMVTCLRDENVEDLGPSLEAFRTRCQAPILVQDQDGPVDGDEPARERTRAVNLRLAEILRTIPSAHRVAYHELVCAHGRRHWYDERNGILFGLPVRSNHHLTMVREWLRGLAALSGRRAKVVVTDLDNTLWGGVLEEGPIHSGAGYPGLLHAAYQRELLALRERGIVLAVASKNDREPVVRTLREHPDLHTRAEHFAVIAADWRAKADNLQGIARELNVGLDSLLFIDDSPLEREQIRQALPTVAVLDLSPDPAGWVQALRDCPLLTPMELSLEDRARARYYTEEAQRQEVRHASASLADFQHSLEVVVESAPVNPSNQLRVAQLTQKTNQFNLTTRRYNEAELLQFLDLGGVNLAFTVKDRFGEYGLVGVILSRPEGLVLTVDIFLLSCRALGRQVEDEMLTSLRQAARTAQYQHSAAATAPLREITS